MTTQLIIGITILIVVVIGMLIAYIYTLQIKIEDTRSFYETELGKLQQIITDKAKSTSAQRSTIKGQLAEQMYPLTDQCGYRLSDMRFMGMPVDYIVFDGYTQCKDEGGKFKEVIFVEIKSGSSQLSRHQRAIRDAIDSGNVRWETITIE